MLRLAIIRHPPFILTVIFIIEFRIMKDICSIICKRVLR